MRIAHIVASVAHEASGPSESVVGLTKALAARGHEVSLHAIGDTPDVPGVRVVRYHHDFPRVAWNAWWSTEMLIGLFRESRSVDVWHNHSLWLPPNIYPTLVPAFTRARLITSPRGTLSPWALAHSRQRKRAVWNLAQKWTLRMSAALHATSAEEAADIRRMVPGKKVVEVPNGFAPSSKEIVERSKTVLFLGRLHEVKGIDLLIDAWARVAPTHPDWNLRIVGPPSAYGERLRADARDRGIERITFDGPLYGSDKHRAYASASVFVLPSHSENFGMVVLEALAQETPVIASRGTPWQALESSGCGMWIDARSELANALVRHMDLPTADAAEMGGRGRAWVEQDFSWDAIALRMEVELYRPAFE